MRQVAAVPLPLLVRGIELVEDATATLEDVPTSATGATVAAAAATFRLVRSVTHPTRDDAAAVESERLTDPVLFPMKVKIRGNEELTDEALQKLAQCCPSLTHLDLRHCRGITTLGLRPLMAACTGLQRLQLASCKRVTEDLCLYVGHSLPGLTHLDLSECGLMTDRAGTEALAEGCLELEFWNFMVPR